MTDKIDYPEEPKNLPPSIKLLLKDLCTSVNDDSKDTHDMTYDPKFGGYMFTKKKKDKDKDKDKKNLHLRHKLFKSIHKLDYSYICSVCKKYDDQMHKIRDKLDILKKKQNFWDTIKKQHIQFKPTSRNRCVRVGKAVCNKAINIIAHAHGKHKLKKK